MNQLIMLIGLPGSGKSYISKLYEDYNYIVHSSDTLRKQLFGDENIQDYNSDLFLELHKRIRNDLLNNKNVVYDATNINRKKRMQFLNYINDIDCEKNCIIIATPFKQCLNQNKKKK